MLISLTKSLLLLFQGATGDEDLAFDCAPWTYNRWRTVFGIRPLESEPEEDEDVVDIGADPIAQGVASAADGFAFSPHALTTVGEVTRQILTDEETVAEAGEFMQSFWEQACRDGQRNHSIDYTINTLPNDTSNKPNAQWPGFRAYKKVALAMLNRRGGILAKVDAIMSRLGFLPVDKWKADREVNRSAPRHARKDDYAIPIPATSTALDNNRLHAEVARELFGKKAVSSGGIVLYGYKSAVHTLLNRQYERNAKQLRTRQNKSKVARDLLDKYLEKAHKSRIATDLFAASKQLVAWRKAALVTLEHDEPHFLSREKQLKELWQELGFQEGDMPRQAVSGSKVKWKSIVPTDEEMQLAYQYYIEEYCNGLGLIDDVTTAATPQFMDSAHRLIDEENDIGVEHLKEWTTEALWTNLGLPGATQFPFAEPGTTGGKVADRAKEAAVPYWHQDVGSHAILEGAFTKRIGVPARPTLLCDDVGLGKTIQIIMVFSMIRHYYEQQALDEKDKLPPPPFTIANGTPYFDGLESIPNLPSLIISPRTLSDQWAEQLVKFTLTNAFSIVRYSVDQGPLEDFCTDPNGAYLKAAGKNQERASSIIILADLSAVANEAKRCLEVPDKSRKRKDAQLEEATGEVAEFKSTVDNSGSLLGMKFRAVAVDECHNLRNSNHAQRGTQVLTNNSHLVIGATATMIFTSLWDALAQARIMRYGPVLGKRGVALSERMMESIKDRTKEWDSNSAWIVKETVIQEATLAANDANMSTQSPLFEDLRRQIQVKYESEEQRGILQSTYIAKGAIEKLRKVLRPIVIRRTGASVNNEGKPILGLPPVQALTAWSPMRRHEMETQREINQEHQKRKRSGKTSGKQDPAMIKWHNFLMSQKDAAVHVLIYQLKKAEAEKRLEKGVAPAELGKKTLSDTIVKSITRSWNESNIDSEASTRMLKADEVVAHFWVGNPPPLAFKEDGTRDLAAVVQEPWPCDKPRKFLIYVAYYTHRDIIGKMFEIKKRGYVCYDGSMVPSKRQAAVTKFNTDPACRIMIISNVGSAGLNLVAASVVIVMSNVWSGLEKNQIFGRVARPGQTRDVVLYNIVAPESIDLALVYYADSKSAQSNQFTTSWKALRQIYVEVTAPEADDDEGDLDSEAAVGPINASKVAVRKRKDRGEDESDNVENFDSSSLAKRTKTSDTTKDPLVQGSGAAKKAKSISDLSHSKASKASASTTQASRIRKSIQAKDAAAVVNGQKIPQAPILKPQGGKQGVPQVSGSHGQATPSDITDQGSQTTPLAKPSLKFKPPPARQVASGSGSKAATQRQGPAEQGSLHPATHKAAVATSMALPPTETLTSTAAPKPAIKKIGFAKPPPKRAVIPVSAAPSSASSEQLASKAPRAEILFAGNQTLSVQKEAQGAHLPITKPGVTPAGTTSSQPLRPIARPDALPPKPQGTFKRPPMKTAIPPEQAQPVTSAIKRPQIKRLSPTVPFLAVPSPSALPSVAPSVIAPSLAVPPQDTTLMASAQHAQPTTVAPSSSISGCDPKALHDTSTGILDCVGDIGPPPASLSPPALPLPPAGWTVQATIQAPELQRTSPAKRPQPLATDDDSSSDGSFVPSDDERSDDEVVHQPPQPRNGPYLIWELPSRVSGPSRGMAPVQSNRQPHVTIARSTPQPLSAARIASTAQRESANATGSALHLSQSSGSHHVPASTVERTYVSAQSKTPADPELLLPKPPPASSQPMPQQHHASFSFGHQGATMQKAPVSRSDRPPPVKVARLAAQERLPSSNPGPSTKQALKQRPRLADVHHNKVTNQAPHKTALVSNRTRISESNGQSSSAQQNEAPRQDPPQSKAIRLPASISSKGGQSSRET